MRKTFRLQPTRRPIYRKPYRIKRKKSIIRNRYFWIGILVSVFIVATFYFLFFSSFFQVEKIIVTGEKKVPKEDLKLLIETKLEKKLLFFKTKSIFLVDVKNIKKDILNGFPRIAEIEISRGFPGALNIIIVERFGLANWCQGGQCFLLDSEGVIFEEISETTNEYLRIQNLTLKRDLEREAYQDSAEGRFLEYAEGIQGSAEGRFLKLGEKAVEPEQLAQILEIESKLKEDLKIPIREFVIASERRVNAKTSEGWEIYFNPKEDLNWQLTKLSLVLKERIPPDKRRNVEYIDLRFEKVYIFPETYQSM